MDRASMRVPEAWIARRETHPSAPETGEDRIDAQRHWEDTQDRCKRGELEAPAIESRRGEQRTDQQRNHSTENETIRGFNRSAVSPSRAIGGDRSWNNPIA